MPESGEPNMRARASPHRMRLQAIKMQVFQVIAGRTREMKVCAIINAHNEGPDLRKTMESYRENRGGAEFSCVIIADGTTDGSADDLPDDVLVVKCPERLGCGKAKDVGVKQALATFEPDVFFHSDGHNRLIRGTLEDIGMLCLDREPCIVTPAVGPLNCMRAHECDKHKTDRCTQACPDILDGDEPPRNCYCGGKITMEGKGELRVDNTIEVPEEEISTTLAVNPSSFAYSVTTLKVLGGWNRYPGWWGSQELGISLRAWFSATPIFVTRPDVCCVLHRYRSWNHPRGKALAPYSIPNGHPEANHRYCLRTVFSEETWRDVWQPWFDRQRPCSEGQAIFESSEAEAQAREFSESCKNRRDGEFFRQVLGIRHPRDNKTREDAEKALYCVTAGMGNVMLCLPAIRALFALSGHPVDLLDCGLHQRSGVTELLEAQPFVGTVHRGPLDLREYRYIVGSYFAGIPGFVPVGAQAQNADRAWRTRHEVESNMDAVRAVGFEGPTPPAELAAWGVPSGLPVDFVAICIGCNTDAKRYPHWEAVCRMLHERGVHMVFTGSSDEWEPWMEQYGENRCGETILEMAGTLREARLYIGLDNGPSHVAAAVGTPVLALYGPTQERKNGPWSTGAKVLRAGMHREAPCWYGRRECRCGA